MYPFFLKLLISLTSKWAHTQATSDSSPFIMCWNCCALNSRRELSNRPLSVTTSKSSLVMWIWLSPKPSRTPLRNSSKVNPPDASWSSLACALHGCEPCQLPHLLSLSLHVRESRRCD